MGSDYYAMVNRTNSVKTKEHALENDYNSIERQIQQRAAHFNTMDKNIKIEECSFTDLERSSEKKKVKVQKKFSNTEVFTSPTQRSNNEKKNGKQIIQQFKINR